MSEKNNNKILALVAVMLFAALGLVLSELLRKVVDDASTSSDGLLGDVLSIIGSEGLLEGLLWLFICFVVYFGVGRVFQHGEKITPLSVLFILLWLFTNFGLIIGNVVWMLISGANVVLDLDSIVALLVAKLEISLGPAFAAALGIANKDY